jgi:NADPH2:quinone reductase
MGVARYALPLRHESSATKGTKPMDSGISAASPFRVEAAHTILAHAATGGVGLILTQWGKYLGATVIGTVDSPEKADKNLEKCR